jgi:hypothetical protein
MRNPRVLPSDVPHNSGASDAAGMRVVAIPNRTFPPSEEALRAADIAIPSLQELHPEVIDPGA